MQLQNMHVALIMDGNRRWARNRGLMAIRGHKAGIQTIENIIVAAKREGVRFITFFAFSTENWSRDKNEVDEMLKMAANQFNNELKSKLLQNGCNIRFIGRRDRLLLELVTAMEEIEKASLVNKDINIIFAVDYSGKLDIIEAAKIVNQAHITEEVFSNAMMTSGIPNPDLLIRTGGEMRISNFFLWQISYCELYFSKKLWPEFSAGDFSLALEDYRLRQRRYGK